jgi:hypothetical protein
MPGLVPGIHAFRNIHAVKAWITGSRTGKATLRVGRFGPVMTKEGVAASTTNALSFRTALLGADPESRGQTVKPESVAQDSGFGAARRPGMTIFLTFSK